MSLPLFLVCARCPRSSRNCAGPCACLEDGKDTTLHQGYRYCPLGKFGEGSDAKPTGWDELPAAPPAPAEQPPVAVPRADWPLSIRALALVAQPGDTGIGDVAHRVLAGMGADALAKLYEQATGKPCGCADRAAKLNQLFPL